ncbi:MAG: hypothetical protein ACJ75J_02960 [Cytophagaceae bacterium]
MKPTVQPGNNTVSLNAENPVEINDIRSIVSDHLTNILLLVGRLDSSQNPRNLPITLTLLMPMVQKLSDLERRHRSFPAVLRESIVIREKYTKVFSIPMGIRRDPTVNGILTTVNKLTNSLVKRYCEEEKRIVAGMLNSESRKKDKSDLVEQALKNLRLLLNYCSGENQALLLRLSSWCEFELSMLE